jgi:mRNA interferase RelE/StbE
LSYAIGYREQALNAAAGLLKDDVDGVRRIMDAVDLLADEPRPAGSVPYGSRDLRRIHVGRYRVLYEIDEPAVAVTVLHIGRTGLGVSRRGHRLSVCSKPAVRSADCGQTS